MRLQAKKMMITALATVALGAGILIGAPFANADDGNGHADPPAQAGNGKVLTQDQVDQAVCEGSWAAWACYGIIPDAPVDVPDNMKRDDGVSVFKNGQWVKYRNEDVTYYTTRSGRKVARPVQGAIPIEGNDIANSGSPFAFIVGLGYVIWLFWA
jgi:hypothetical protein